MRAGSVAAAPFVGDQFASLYLGATRVPTVPGRPEWDGAPPASGGENFIHGLLAPPNDGGSEITGYNIYVAQDPPSPEGSNLDAVDVTFNDPGTYSIAVAAVNAVGEGPRLIHLYEFAAP